MTGALGPEGDDDAGVSERCVRRKPVERRTDPRGGFDGVDDDVIREGQDGTMSLEPGRGVQERRAPGCPRRGKRRLAPSRAAIPTGTTPPWARAPRSSRPTSAPASASLAAGEMTARFSPRASTSAALLPVTCRRLWRTRGSTPSRRRTSSACRPSVSVPTQATSAVGTSMRGGDGLIGRLAADLCPRLDRHAGLAGCRQLVDAHDAVDVDASHDDDVGHRTRSSPRICSITRVTLKPSCGDTVAVATSCSAIASSRSLMRMFHSHSRTGSSSTGKVSK